ncbi:CRISPR-associated endoribonuclease Cas6 [uncultured Proteiniphilum sp.]|uniref:CRISPR-associated endoribonuclease Cas6 n=1 Tax=uncultured Proteiniphilum sp. TaxID=497637 RepID=UPI002628AC8F|nr:CRISPR-associated endoribonuclease Cas6 [uncultured Proteiniphilum sp.]
MRFKLLLNIDKQPFGNLIPLNYQYAASALIYKILSNSESDFSEWLHENGFNDNKRRFKLFTFSRLFVPRYSIENGYLKILSDTAEWYISFLPERSTREFVQGLFNKQLFELGDRNARIRFNIESVEMLSPPVFKETRFETLSPACIVRQEEDGSEKYISSDHPEAAEIVKLNLLNKYKAFHGFDFPMNGFPFRLKTLTQPRSSLITIKEGTPQESKIRGFMCRFELTASLELMQIIYDTGLGSKNSQEFGYIR